MTKKVFSEVKLFLKTYWKPLLFIFLFYCFSFLAIIRANEYYVDDTGRAVIGYGWTSDFKRYSSTFLSFFLLNMNTKVVDLSPFTQIFALLLTAFSSVFLCLILSGKKNGAKLSTLSLVLSTFLGIAPYSISLWIYKFDAPCMALALFVSIVPFLFRSGKNRFLYPVASIFCLLILWTSYQAFSGVYSLLCLLIVVNELTSKKKTKPTIRFLLISVGSYLLSAILYKILPDVGLAPSYRSTEIFGMLELVPGIINNLRALFATIWSDFPLAWKVLLSATIVVFPLSFIFKKGNHAKNFGIGFLTLLAIFTTCFGPFLALKELALQPRSLCAFSVALACLGIILGNNLKKKLQLLSIPSLLLIYSFMIFSFALGNALAGQKAYSTFRNSTLASDLSRLYPDSSEFSQKQVQILGDIGLSAVTKHASESYPLIPRIIDESQTGLSEHVWGTRRLLFYYGLKFDNYFVAKNEKFDYELFNIKLDSQYHKIYESQDSTKICIVLK